VTGAAPSPEPVADAEATTPADTEALPANRAGRRARKSGQLPTHAGPRSDEHPRRGKGPRSHTKRG
jgi:hypothetical protein